MEWEFKQDMDHIFDVIKKTSKVIKSCKNSIHVEGAYNYLANLERYLMVDRFFGLSRNSSGFAKG